MSNLEQIVAQQIADQEKQNDNNPAISRLRTSETLIAISCIANNLGSLKDAFEQLAEGKNVDAKLREMDRYARGIVQHVDRLLKGDR